MKTITFLLYTFFSLIVISCFAAISKFQIGFYGIAFGALSFAILFIYLLLNRLANRKSEKANTLDVLELGGLMLYAVVIFLKSYQLLFLGITWLHIAAVLFLLVVIVLRIKTWRELKNEMPNRIYLLNTIVLVCYILFLVTDLIWKFTFSAPMVLMTIVLGVSLVPLISMAVMRTSAFLKEGKKVITLDVELFKGYWLYLAYILIFAYQVATHTNFIDEVEFKRLPPKYVELFYAAESGAEEPVNGEYRYEKFLREYKKLMAD